MTTRIAFGLVFVTSINFVFGFFDIENKLFHKSLTKSINPDVYLTTPQIIARRGYPAEAYTVPTDDGFLLTVHRIPYTKYSKDKKPGQPVFLQHGLLGASSDWVLAGNNSLAFILSDAGYDVWLGNARGNSYSRGHIRYTPKDKEFWDFSWHEMAIYDLPGVLSFIGNYTNQTGEIIYIGHSMGTTMFFAYSSTHAKAPDTVKMMVALAPVAFMSDVRSPIKYIAPWANDIEWLAQYFGINEFLPNSKILGYLADIGCDHAVAEMNLCEDIIFLFCGFDKAEFNKDILSAVLSHEPAGTSTKTIVHYAQEIKSGGRFCEFDYGSTENMRRYGTKIPPSYNVTDITVPVYLMSSANDWLAGPGDVYKLSNILPNKIGDYLVPMKQFNHIDFLYGKDAPQLVYKQLLKIIGQYGINK